MTSQKTPAALPVPSWYRRVVPAGYATATLTLTGTSALLMNSPEADRESDLYRAFTALATKSGRTEDEDARLRELEWKVRIYFDDELGPYIPGRCVKAVLWEAAGKYKKAATVKRSLITIHTRIPLEYEGPRDEAGLWEAGYRYTTMVQNAGFGSGRVQRCRPMFPRWSLTVEIAFDPEEIDPHTLALIAERAQRYGLGDYRPQKGGEFGAFSASLAMTTSKRRTSGVSASKRRNGHEEEAHEAFRARIMEPVEA